MIDQEVPEPGRNELLLRVLRVGICGTDRDIVAGFYGEAPPSSSFLVLGHESICRVASGSPIAPGLKKGDLVVPTVRRGCQDRCLNCRAGESDMCLTGHYKEHGIKQLHGFARELAVSDAGFVVRLPEGLAEVGVLLEPLTVVEKGLLQATRIQSSRMKWKPESALVLGAGPVGILATALLRLSGLTVHTVATRSSRSLKARLVERTGATYINAKEAPLEGMAGRYDMVFELTGSASVALEAQNLTKVNGVVSYLGIYRDQIASEDAGSVFTNLVLGNRVFLGSVNANKSYFVKGARDMSAMKTRWPGLLESMVTRVWDPERCAEAYSHGDEEEIKSVVRFA
ncbi:MAG TPA: glucose 1-dehydrogenase [Nitrososphaerales archaeon]|nr:glucose 1-dehydrogenase [Nitrososphaerales archaeon]